MTNDCTVEVIRPGEIHEGDHGPDDAVTFAGDEPVTQRKSSPRVDAATALKAAQYPPYE